MDRGGFKRKGNGAGDNLPANVPTPERLMQCAEPRQMLESALVAFSASFGALFNQAEVEARRLLRMNLAIDMIERQILDPDKVAQLTDAQAANLLQVLSYNARGSTAALLEISKTIMSSRGTVAILSNLRAVATSYANGGSGPAPIESQGGSGNGIPETKNGGGKMAGRFIGS